VVFSLDVPEAKGGHGGSVEQDLNDWEEAREVTPMMLAMLIITWVRAGRVFTST